MTLNYLDKPSKHAWIRHNICLAAMSQEEELVARLRCFNDL